MLSKSLFILIIAFISCVYASTRIGSGLASNYHKKIYVNSKDCKNTYVCDLGDTDWLGRRYVTNCYNRNTRVGGEIRIDGFKIGDEGDSDYTNPDNCKNISRHVSTSTGCYYTPDKKHGYLYRGKVDQKARVYDKVGSYCLTEFGWCWCSN